MKIELSSKVVFITGGLRGIGLAITKQLLESGAKVVTLYNSTQPADDFKKNPDCNLLKADLNSVESLEGVFNSGIEAFGKIDVLINNAGIALPTDPDGDVKTFIQNWTKTMNVNLLAAGVLCQQAIGHFKKRNEGGIIINIALIF